MLDGSNEIQEYKDENYVMSADNYSNNTNNKTSIPHSFHNITLSEDYIFDRTDVKVIFITLYSIVFFSCVLGK